MDPVPFTDLGAMTRELRPELDAAIDRVISTGSFVGGDAVERFEEAWARYCGTRYAVGVGNGTDALALTLRSLDLGPDAEVVVPANTFVATAEAVVLAGARPRFADVSAQTLLLTPATLEAALGPRTRAVVVVHLYGQMADMDSLRRVTESAGVPLIEDAAQGHGATWNGHRAGSLGRAGCFSFYPGKNLGAFGDAGAVVTNDADLAASVRCLRDHGRVPGSHHLHRAVGTNSRLDTVQAAVLYVKLRRLDAWTQARRHVAQLYRESLSRTGVQLVSDDPQSRSVYHLLVARVPDRARVRAGLADVGIATGIHYPIPCHEQPPFHRYRLERLPAVEEASAEVLSLPMHPHLTEEQVARVCAALSSLVSRTGRSHVA